MDKNIDERIDCFLLKPIEFEQMFEQLQKIEVKFKI